MRAPYPQIGVPEAHHPLSHHNNLPELVAHMSKINRYPRGALLEVRGEAAGDPGRRRQPARPHDHHVWHGPVEQHAPLRDNLPIMLIGGGAGRLPSGRHIRYGNGPSLANLLLTLMDKMDVPVERVGGSTGRLPLDSLSDL